MAVGDRWEDMDKIERINRVVHSYKNDLCPKCEYKLDSKYTDKTNYRCHGCGFSFWENQFSEVYLDEVIRVIDSD